MRGKNPVSTLYYTSNEAMTNFPSCVMSNKYDSILAFSEDNFSVPFGLSQLYVMSLLHPEQDTDDSIFNIADIDVTQSTYYSKCKPVFDDLMKETQKDNDLETTILNDLST